jgi:Ca-activated chloride channel family protein
MVEFLQALVGDFHFLRPWMLLGIPVGAVLGILAYRREDRSRAWAGVIEPHLLQHLVVTSGSRSRYRPPHAVALALTLGSLGVAGPTWEREQTPFSEDVAPLVIVMDLGPTMDAVDVAPSRLERAEQKVLDLLARRKGARTGLIVYSGTAYSVLPFTDDPSVLESYVASLRTDIMPLEGKDATAALGLAEEVMLRDTVPGTILFVTDGIGLEHTEAFVQHSENSRDLVMVLAVGTREGGPIPMGENRFRTDESGRRVMATLDETGLQALRDRGAADVMSSTVDDTDVERIQRRTQSNLAARRDEAGGVRWKDQGWWLVIPTLLAFLGMFRRGWTVPWMVVIAALALGMGAGPAGAQEQGIEPEGSAGPTVEAPGLWTQRWLDLWWTRDQQGTRLMEEGRYREAAERFQDPVWKATAYYRASDYENTIGWFAREDTPESAFNLGNAYALMGDYDAALASFDAALAARPDWPQARANRELVASLIPPPPEEGPPPERNEDPSFDPDAVEIDEEGGEGAPGEVPMDFLSEEQIEAMWLRGLQSNPADYLRNRFFLERLRSGRTGGGP